jgi:hypothetical protein
MEIGTPLRFILTHAPLQWAYYITVLSVLLFMIFEAKRKQRIIPVIRPLGNTTLEFIRTIGSLYFQRQDHKNVAEKKIHYLMDLIRSHYWIQTHSLDEGFVVALAGKTGKPEQDVRELVEAIADIRAREKISANELVNLNTKIEEFIPQLPLS